MPRLKDPQHEIYATERAAGKSAKQAYRLAGFSSNNAVRFEKTHPAVRHRIAEKVESAAELAELNLGRLLIEAGRIALANHTHFYENTERGYVLRDITKLPKDLQSAFAGIKVEADGRVELRVHDKNAALFALIKHFGGMPDDAGDKTVNFNFFDSLSIDDQQVLVDALKALPGRAGEDTSPGREEHREGAPPA